MIGLRVFWQRVMMRVKLYKYLSIVLASLLLFAGVGFLWQKNSWSKQRKQLNNALAEVAELQQETESAYSKVAVENEGLKSQNGQLQEIIDDRNEEVLALTQANVRLKDKLFAIEDAKGSVENPDGDPVDSGDFDCIGDSRFRVEFSKEDDPIRVSGYTLTNPAYAEVKLEWMRDLKLDIILTVNEDGTYTVYIDSEKSDLVPTAVNVQVDSTILNPKWYERISIGGAIAIGPSVLTSANLGLDLANNWVVGPSFTILSDGKSMKKFYGANVLWYPWRK